MERFAINILHKKIHNICRLCGVDNPDKVPIIDEDAVICLDDDEATMAKKIEECVGIRVCKTDQMPQQICTLCIDKVNDFFEYRSMCAATNLQTRTILNLPIVQPTKTLVKAVPPTKAMVVAPSIAGLKRGAKTRCRKNDDVDSKDFLGASSEKRIKQEYACQYCNAVYEKNSDLERHLVVKHTPLIRKYGCGTCAENFDSAVDHKEHTLWHKLTRTMYNCFRCKRKFAKSATLSKHLELNICGRVARRTKIALVPDLRCKLCNKVFKTQNLYEWHGCFVRARSNCLKCGKYFLKKNLLMRHYMLHCTGTLALAEPEVVLKEEPGPVMANEQRDRIQSTVEGGKEGKRKGRSKDAVHENTIDMKEETSELPFSPLLDPPEVKLESSSVDGQPDENTSLGADNQRRANVAIDKTADMINTPSRASAGEDTNSDFATISPVITFLNKVKAIATISNVRKNKKIKDTSAANLDENIEMIPSGQSQPMVVLSMANLTTEFGKDPSLLHNTVVSTNDSEQHGLNSISTNTAIVEEGASYKSNGDENFTGEIGCDSGENFADDGDNDSGNNFRESTSIRSGIQYELPSRSSLGRELSDLTEVTLPIVRVKQEPMVFDEDSGTEFGEYETAISCLAIKHEPADEDYADDFFREVDRPRRSSRRMRNVSATTYQALRIKIKKEKDISNASVVEKDSDATSIPLPPANVVEKERYAVQRPQKIAKKVHSQDCIADRSNRSEFTTTGETEESIKQEQPDPDQHNDEQEDEEVFQTIFEACGTIRIKEEPLDTSSEHSKPAQPVPSRLSFEENAGGSYETIIAFDGTRIKQERRQEISKIMSATAPVNATNNMPLGNRTKQIAPTIAGGSASISHKSSKRINPFAFLKKKTLGATDMYSPLSDNESGPSSETLSLPVITQVTSIDLNEHLATPSESIALKGNVTIDSYTEPSGLSNDLYESDKAQQASSAVTAETEIAARCNTEKELTVENIVVQHGTIDLIIAAVTTIEEVEELAREDPCSTLERPRALVLDTSSMKDFKNTVGSRRRDHGKYFVSNLFDKEIDTDSSSECNSERKNYMNIDMLENQGSECTLDIDHAKSIASNSFNKEIDVGASSKYINQKKKVTDTNMLEDQGSGSTLDINHGESSVFNLFDKEIDIDVSSKSSSQGTNCMNADMLKDQGSGCARGIDHAKSIVFHSFKKEIDVCASSKCSHQGKYDMNTNMPLSRYVDHVQSDEEKSNHCAELFEETAEIVAKLSVSRDKGIENDDVVTPIEQGKTSYSDICEDSKRIRNF